MDKEVPLDDLVEFVAKKFFYRPEQLLPRDIFDLATVYNSERKDDIIKSIVNLEDKAESFIKTFMEKENSLNDELYSIEFEHNLLPGGFEIKGIEIEYCKNFVLELNGELKKVRENERLKIKRKN